MSKYNAEVQIGDLYGIKIVDGVYVLEDNKMYTESDAEEMGGVTTVTDGPEVEISGAAVTLAADYVSMQNRKNAPSEGEAA